jgi:putative oxidoreductase
MLEKIVTTTDDRAALILRLTLGIVMFPHGAQKALGWFGGGGIGGTLEFFSSAFGVPAVLALLVIAAEFLGSIALIVGLFTRVAAAGIIGVMLGAVAMVHWQVGFFMNWTGAQQGEGFEFHLLAIGIGLALVLLGGGSASLDREVLAPRLRG